MHQPVASPVTAPHPRGRLAPSAFTHPASRVFVILGTVAVVGGALLSAAIAPTPSYHGSWAVAYIVLVAGVAQIALGVAQTSATAARVPRAVISAEAVCFNVGAAATVTATILSLTPVLYAAAALQVAALAVFLTATRRGRTGAALLSVRVIAALLLISVPTGIVLQALTH